MLSIYVTLWQKLMNSIQLANFSKMDALHRGRFCLVVQNPGTVKILVGSDEPIHT